MWSKGMEWKSRYAATEERSVGGETAMMWLLVYAGYAECERTVVVLRLGAGGQM